MQFLGEILKGKQGKLWLQWRGVSDKMKSSCTFLVGALSQHTLTTFHIILFLGFSSVVNVGMTVIFIAFKIF